MIDRPASFFSNRLGCTKELVSKGWRCWVETWVRITAGCSSQLGLAFVSFQIKTGIMWEVGGNAISCEVKLMIIQLKMLPEINFTYVCILHIAAGWSAPFCLLFRVNVQTKQHRNHLVLKFWKWKSWSTKTGDANSTHVLHLCANTSSRLVFFFCAPNQWPFLVVCWNQFIPQQGSYIQTFKVLIW